MSHPVKTVRPKIKLTRRKTVKTIYGRSKLVGRKYASEPKIRESLKPGAILILLTGSYRGKRVILLKVLRKSGLLVVTGPFLFNGVPLRRVNPRYVIATSTNIFEMNEIDGKKCHEAVEAVTSSLTDDCFGKTKSTKIAEFKARKKLSKSIGDMDVDDAPETIDDGAKEKIRLLQDKVDGALTPFLKKYDTLCQYLKTRFTLRNNMYPHLLKF